MRERELFLFPFEDPFGSAKKDKEAKEERDLSNASLLGVSFLAATLSTIREKEIANASSVFFFLPCRYAFYFLLFERKR
jgi:hypothetical protein